MEFPFEHYFPYDMNSQIWFWSKPWVYWCIYSFVFVAGSHFRWGHGRFPLKCRKAVDEWPHYRCIAVLHRPLLYFSSPFDTTQASHRFPLISIASRTHNQTSCSQSFTPGQGRASQYTHPWRLPACICPSLSHGVLLACSAHPARDGNVWRGRGRKQVHLFSNSTYWLGNVGSTQGVIS
jgi:hypothetical protein